jgi:hypothetical protein
MTVDDAKTLATFISAVVIPFAVIWLQKVTWSPQAKFALAVVLSLLAGGLTAYVAGQIVVSGSLIQNAAVIFTAAQIVYYGAFRTLGLERVLFPQEALVNQAKEQVAQEPSVSNATRQEAKDILDPTAPPALNVEATVVNVPGTAI